MILHSPTERGAVVKSLVREAAVVDIEVTSSAMCEKRGVDFLWHEQGQWWGVQRKELHDLLASFDDGRLTKEIAQMSASVTMPHLVIEGRIQVDNEGWLVTKGFGRQVSIVGLRKRLLTIGYRGVFLSYTASARETGAMIVDTYMWSQSASHSTAATRPAAVGAWGTPTNRDYQLHLLQGLPDVGPKLAGAILDHFGRCPLVLDLTERELTTVPGIGRVKARKILASIESRELEIEL